MMTPKVVEESCGAIVWTMKEGKPRFLVLQRADEENVWEPPKGHRQEGESEKQTATRELKEELSIENPSFHPSFREVLEYTNSKGIIIYYVLFLFRAGNIAISSEHSAYRWIPIEEIDKYFTYDDIKEIYRKASQTILSINQEAET